MKSGKVMKKKVKEDIKLYFDGVSLIEEYFVDVFTQ